MNPQANQWHCHANPFFILKFIQLILLRQGYGGQVDDEPAGFSTHPSMKK
jgi:hypothetical protein